MNVSDPGVLPLTGGGDPFLAVAAGLLLFAVALLLLVARR